MTVIFCHRPDQPTDTDHASGLHKEIPITLSVESLPTHEHDSDTDFAVHHIEHLSKTNVIEEEGDLLNKEASSITWKTD